MPEATGGWRGRLGRSRGYGGDGIAAILIKTGGGGGAETVGKPWAQGAACAAGAEKRAAIGPGRLARQVPQTSRSAEMPASSPVRNSSMARPRDPSHRPRRTRVLVQLDCQLPAERGPHGEPTAADFAASDPLIVVERFATLWDIWRHWIHTGGVSLWVLSSGSGG